MCPKRLRWVRNPKYQKIKRSSTHEVGLENVQDREVDLVCELLKAKYLRRSSFADSKDTMGSQFRKGIHKVKEKFEWGAIFQVNNGQNTKF